MTRYTVPDSSNSSTAVTAAGPEVLDTEPARGSLNSTRKWSVSALVRSSSLSAPCRARLEVDTDHLRTNAIYIEGLVVGDHVVGRHGPPVSDSTDTNTRA